MDHFLNKLIISKAGYEALILRVPIGLILAAHGSQKLFGWFGGDGLVETGQFMTKVGLEPGYLMALLAGSVEFIGGLGLILGLFTRLAAAITAITMLVALLAVHRGNGFFLQTHGIEYAFALLSATITLFITGGGNYSIDHFLEHTFLSEH